MREPGAADSFDVAIGARQADDGHSTISLATINCRQERKDEETAEECSWPVL
jgi:hypothetical protein